MAIGHGELLQECFPKHSRMGTERNKTKRQTKTVRREALVWKEAKRARKKTSPDGLSHPNQNTIIINKIWYYFIRNGKSTMKFNWQKKMDLNIWKITNHPPSPLHPQYHWGNSATKNDLFRNGPAKCSHSHASKENKKWTEVSQCFKNKLISFRVRSLCVFTETRLQ